MMKKCVLTVVMGLLITVASSASATVTAPKILETFGDWSTYTFTENGNKVCYMVSKPTKHEGRYTRRGDIFALITHRPSDQAFDVVSFIAGYTHKKDSAVKVSIGSRTFTLFTEKDGAWAEDATTDKRLAQAIREGSTMVVRGTSSRGTLTKDTYSLRGSTAAYRAMSRACNVRR